MSEPVSPFMAPRITVQRRQTSLGAAADLSRGLELLAGAKTGAQGPLLRLYRPEPTVAFGQRDANLPGFADAAQAASVRGFEPLVRKAGGRAAAYHQGCLIVDHIQPEKDAIAAAKGRFGFFGQLLATALGNVGVDAAVGEIPGEYCPGEYSVHGSGAGTQVKLVGTAQRVVSGAWLFSSVVVVENSAPLREVLTGCYAALGLEWNPATAGAAEDLVPGTIVDAVEDAILEVYARYTELDGL